MKQQLQDTLQELAAKLIENNIENITSEVLENVDGKLSISVGIKIHIVGPKVHTTGALAYSRKFREELESCFERQDPNQPSLLRG